MGLRQVVSVGHQLAEGVEGFSNIWMLISQILLAYRQGLTFQPFRLKELMPAVGCPGHIVEGSRHIWMIRAKQPLLHPQIIPPYRFGFGPIALVALDET